MLLSLSIVLQILLHHLHGGDDALAEDVLMSIESQMGEKGAIDILYELVQSHRKHDKIMLSHLHTSLKRIRKDASENSQVYSDVSFIFVNLQICCELLTSL